MFYEINVIILKGFCEILEIIVSFFLLLVILILCHCCRFFFSALFSIQTADQINNKYVAKSVS